MYHVIWTTHTSINTRLKVTNWQTQWVRNLYNYGNWHFFYQTETIIIISHCFYHTKYYYIITLVNFFLQVLLMNACLSCWCHDDLIATVNGFCVCLTSLLLYQFLICSFLKFLKSNVARHCTNRNGRRRESHLKHS